MDHADGTGNVTRRELLTAAMPRAVACSRVEVREVSLGPRQPVGLHLHPCPVAGVILEGTVIYQIEGEEARRLRAGEAFFEPPHARIARFDNEGDLPVRFAAFYLMEDGQDELIRMLEA